MPQSGIEPKASMAYIISVAVLYPTAPTGLCYSKCGYNIYCVHNEYYFSYISTTRPSNDTVIGSLESY
jgi:hypothetical protein